MVVEKFEDYRTIIVYYLLKKYYLKEQYLLYIKRINGRKIR